MVEFYGSSCITQKYRPVKCLYFYIFMHFLTTSLNFNMLSQKIILCCCSIVHHVINPCCSPSFFFMEVQEVELHQVIVDSLIQFFIESFFLIRLGFLLITIVNSSYIYMPNHRRCRYQLRFLLSDDMALLDEEEEMLARERDIMMVEMEGWS